MRIEQRAALIAAGGLTMFSAVGCDAVQNIAGRAPTPTAVAEPQYNYAVGVDCVSAGGATDKYLRLRAVWNGFLRREPILTFVGEQGSQKQELLELNLNTQEQGRTISELRAGIDSRYHRDIGAPSNTLVTEFLGKVTLEAGKTYVFDIFHADPNGGKGPYESAGQFHPGKKLTDASVTIPDCK